MKMLWLVWCWWLLPGHAVASEAKPAVDLHELARTLAEVSRPRELIKRSGLAPGQESPFTAQAHKDLADALGKVVGIDESHLRKLSKRQPVSDPAAWDAPAQPLQAEGKGPVLWVFWAKDAPGVQNLASSLAALAKARPEIQIQDVHMMSLLNWQAALDRAHAYKVQLETNDPAIDDETELAAKRVLHKEVLAEWQGFTAMAQSRRVGGYLLFEDVTAAKVYDIRRIPALRYRSARGVIHGVEGLHRQTDVAALIAQWEAYELKHWDELQKRLQQAQQRAAGGAP